ncbi:MAG TPA: heavy metal translocating P-type ATPase, partial [Candidatus Limnocylindria bacterium]|nr:heavy metal translocating P-type ATPase [Candidatus Limnocylindria bacterium]
MTQRKFRVPAAAALLAAGLLLGEGTRAHVWVLLAAYFISGYDVLAYAAQGIARGRLFDENFLMSIATVGAIVIGEYAEAVAVMVFYQTGEMFQGYAVDRSRRSIAQAMDLRPDSANVLMDSGMAVETDPEQVEVGARILVRPGELVPLDGVVLDGESQMDTAALTGESVPRGVLPGDEVLSGSVNLTGVLTVRVTKPFGQSTVSRILEMVQSATDRKSRQENFITRFSQIYTPAVVVTAALLAFIPPLLVPGALLADWGYRALNFLVVSCPCALVSSIPLSFFGGLGGASRAGILAKGSNYLEALARAETFVFDKTGTLTRGSFTLREALPRGVERGELLEAAALSEQHSGHPIAQAIRQSWAGTADPTRVSGVEELAGGGVRALVDGREVLVGNLRLMQKHGVAVPDAPGNGTVSHVARDGAYIGSLVVSDEIKPCARQALHRLRDEGIRHLVMLTGDSEAAGRAVAKDLDIDVVHTGLLPQDKVVKLEELLSRPGRRGTLAFVGDGVNDAPVLARADVGFAMGALGSDAAIEAADIVIMNDDPCKMAAALTIARKTVAIATQNAFFAIGVKALVLGLSALGLSTLWMAVFADVGVTILAVLNAMRALRVKEIVRTCACDLEPGTYGAV